MNLTKIPDNYDLMCFEILQSDDGIVRMGIYPVAFGFRVRGWYNDNLFCEIDWCGGANQADVERLYSILRNILLNKPENRAAFNGIPGWSKVKPYYNDDEFVRDIVSKITAPFDLVKLPPLQELKRKALEHQLFKPPT